jgi:hypothetical protein
VADVFISYNKKERDAVAPIAARLSELGVDAWFDRRIPAGQSFGAHIRARLNEARAVLVCWSQEATQSQWVDAEADYARETNKYVPIYIAPCSLMPPFNRIHTEDLSSWDGSTTDPAWLKVVESISKLLGRDGVAAAAHAFATGDEQALYEFALKFPEEPTADRVWNTAVARYREEFNSRLAEARAQATTRVARINAEATDREERVEATVPAFEAWLVEERRGMAAGPKPDPVAIVKRYVSAEEKKLRDDKAALSSGLAQTNEELELAKGEISRLSDELAAANERLNRFEIVNASPGPREELLAKELDSARGELQKLSNELSAKETEVNGLRIEKMAFSNAEALRKSKTIAADRFIDELRQKLLTQEIEMNSKCKTYETRIEPYIAETKSANSLADDVKAKLATSSALVTRLSALKGADEIINPKPSKVAAIPSSSKNSADVKTRNNSSDVKKGGAPWWLIIPAIIIAIWFFFFHHH